MFIIDLGAQSDYSILGVSTDADAKEIRASWNRIGADLERQRQKARTKEEKDKLTERQLRINEIGGRLTNAAKRAEYDKQNVHLTFFIVRKSGTPIWDERHLLLRWMHAVVREFVLARGEEVEPLNDLERTDFSADFTNNELLEQLLQQHSQERP